VEADVAPVDVALALQAIVTELRQQRDAIQALQDATWIRYVQEIGRSTLPGGMRLDVLLVLGAAGAAGLLGVQGDTVGRVLGALVGGTAP